MRVLFCRESKVEDSVTDLFKNTSPGEQLTYPSNTKLKMEKASRNLAKAFQFSGDNMINQ